MTSPGLPILNDLRTSAVNDGAAPAPEREAAPSAWSLLPHELSALGYSGSAGHLFGRLQRVNTWDEGGAPDVGRAGRAVLAGLDLTLPRLHDVQTAKDGASRCVLETADGHKIEAVHMPRSHVKVPRTTLCISSQVGCAMGCTFCATGTMGIVRNLSAGEIVGEVLTLMRALGPSTGHHVNVVFMGMGEPLHNLVHLKRAVEVLCDERGVGLSRNRITVSTSGLVPGIEALAQWPVRPLLALSVNATTDAARSRIMPVNKSYNLQRLKETLLRFPLRHGEKILLEYVLLKGENDSDDDAVRLADFARGLRHNVNVIPLNEHSATSFGAPSDDAVDRFARRLSELGCLCTIRQNRARDVRGACGQLVQESARKKTSAGA